MPRQPGLRPDGPKIRQLRVDRGITVTDLARKIGRHKDSLFGIEGKKKRAMSDVFASQLARALSTSDDPVTVKDITDRAD